jgi:hypothetical protein
MEEVLAQFFLGDQVGSVAVMLRRLKNGDHRGLLSPLGQAPQVHVLDHSLSEGLSWLYFLSELRVGAGNIASGE